jgi:hypothetical protein
MNALVKVARYHLVNRIQFIGMPWGDLGFAFGICLIVFWAIAPPASGSHTGALATIYVVFFVLGLLSVSRSLPFGLALGVSRRSYYLGTVLLAVALAAVYGLALTLLQVLERATGGWGLHMKFFRVAYLLSGPWYLTWLTSFVGLALLFIYGMWFGLVWRRWGLVGLMSFIAAQVTLLLAGALAVTWTHVWKGVGHFFTVISAAGLTGLLAGLAAVLVLAGLATMRRVTI